MTEIKNKKGEIQNHPGSKIDGLINVSDLTEFRSSGESTDYSIKYVIEGQEEYSIDGRQYTLNPGQFLVVRPEQEISISIESDKSVRGICVYLSSEIVGNNFGTELKSTYHTIPNFPISCTNTPMYELFSNLSDQSHVQDSDYFLRTFYQNFNHLILTSNKCVENLSMRKTSTKMDLWEKIERARYFMEINLERPILLEDIASASYISTFHFHRIFKSIHGISPSKYLFNLRMIRAKELLKEENLNLPEVAFKCGFEDVKYFKKCLKTFNGFY